MQKPELTISKNTFYKDGRAFAETAPPSECEEHSVCGCTRYVAERPTDGKIGQVKLGLSLDCGEQPNAFHKGALEINASLGTFSLNANNVERYDDDDYLWCFIKPFERHVYLYLYKNRLNFEYHIPGYGFVDYMFLRVYRGNEIDRSKLFNGHSPPRIDTRVADERQLWVYECLGGKEGFSPISDDALQQVMDTGNEMLSMLSQMQFSHNSEVEEIYLAIERSGFVQKSMQIEKFLRGFDLRNHELFDAIHSMDSAVYGQDSMFREKINDLHQKNVSAKSIDWSK